MHGVYDQDEDSTFFEPKNLEGFAVESLKVMGYPELAYLDRSIKTKPVMIYDVDEIREVTIVSPSGTRHKIVASPIGFHGEAS